MGLFRERREVGGIDAQARVGKGLRWSLVRRILKFSAAAIVLVVVAAVVWAWAALRASLPELEGTFEAQGLARPVAIERDSLGVPRIRGAAREDVAFGLGFAHAQDRLFQMDLLRRQSAGELAGLFGAGLVAYDGELRAHRLRAVAERALAGLPTDERALLESYARGVEEGRRSLAKKPFEYLLLGIEPEPWRAEDSLLVLLTMFVALQDDDGSYETFLSRLEAALPKPLFEFLTPLGTRWDSALADAAMEEPAIPGAETCNLVGREPAAPVGAKRESPSDAASNAWALAGARTASGEAILAADLHVDLRVPILWYRAALVWTGATGAEVVVQGATIPGAPLVVVGSNGKVAWAFTNSRVDVTDLVELELVPGEPGEADRYQTADGPETVEVFRERIAVRGGAEETIAVPWTRWGPVVERDGRKLAVRWVAHEASAVNMGLRALELATDVPGALDAARRSGMPALNVFVADDGGHVGFTLAGKVPRRQPAVGRVERSWRDVDPEWNRFLAGDEVPQVVDPPSNFLWNGNNRTVAGQQLAAIGDGNYVLGARAEQIRQQLEPLEGATVADMLAIQLDDRALFFERWQGLLVRLLAGADCTATPARCELRRHVEAWGGRASVDSVGYTLVREFRHRVGEKVFTSLVEGCRTAGSEPLPLYYDEYNQAEGPLWRLLEARPPHLLPAGVASWDEWLLAAVDTVIAQEETPLAERRWGEKNRLAMEHFLGGVIPFAGGLLNMPADPLPGDDHMPRVQAPSYGASMRLALSPGREHEGYFEMPGGQSGHPLSPHYRDSHPAWVRGELAPFVAGPAVHVLRLEPRSPGTGAGDLR